MMRATSASLVAPTRIFLPDCTVYCLASLPVASSSCSSVVSSSSVTGGVVRALARRQRPRTGTAVRVCVRWRTLLHGRRDLPLLELELADLFAALAHFLYRSKPQPTNVGISLAACKPWQRVRAARTRLTRSSSGRRSRSNISCLSRSSSCEVAWVACVAGPRMLRKRETSVGRGAGAGQAGGASGKGRGWGRGKREGTGAGAGQGGRGGASGPHALRAPSPAASGTAPSAPRWWPRCSPTRSLRWGCSLATASCSPVSSLSSQASSSRPGQSLSTNQSECEGTD